ncbi:MAG: hypothetical protein ABL982_01625 [Vicinamibacterales bacterium]
MTPKSVLVPTLFAFAAVVGLGVAALEAQAPTAPPPFGAWFGVARPCTLQSRFPKPEGTDDQEICQKACPTGTCPQVIIPADAVTMAPTLLSDGTVIADDMDELFTGHTSGLGKWEYGGTTTLGGRTVQQINASFIWFQPRSPADTDPKNLLSRFAGVARPRFVMFYDPMAPDLIRGFIQPFLYTLTDCFGELNLLKGTPFPTPDPIGSLPATCDPTQTNANPLCLGTLHFVVRRIPAR